MGRADRWCQNTWLRKWMSQVDTTLYAGAMPTTCIIPISGSLFFARLKSQTNSSCKSHQFPSLIVYSFLRHIIQRRKWNGRPWWGIDVCLYGYMWSTTPKSYSTTKWIHVLGTTLSAAGVDALWHLTPLFIYMIPCICLDQPWDQKWSDHKDHYVKELWSLSCG